MLRGLTIIALCIGMASAIDAAPPPRATQATPPIASLQAIEPKPNGVINRFGSTRFRYPGYISSMVLSPDGKCLAAAGFLGVRVFEVATGNAIWKKPKTHEGITSQYGSITFLSSNIIATICEEDRIYSLIYRHCIVTNRIVSKTKIRSNTKRNYTFSPDGLLVATSDGTQLVIYDATNGKMIRRLQTPARKSVSDITFSPNGKTLFAIIDDLQIVFYDRLLGCEVTRADVDLVIGQPRYNSDGSKVIGLAAYNFFETVDTRTGKRVGRLKSSNTDRLKQFQISCRDEIVVQEVNRYDIRVAQFRTGKQLDSFLCDFRIRNMILSHDDKTLFVASYEGAIAVYDFATRQKQSQSADTDIELSLRSYFYPRLRYSDDHRLTSIGHQTYFWNTATGRRSDFDHNVKDWRDVSPDGMQLLTIDKQGVSERSVLTGLISKQYASHQISNLKDVDYSDDGSAIVGYGDKQIVSWNRSTKRLDIQPIAKWKDRVFSGDGTRFAWTTEINDDPKRYELGCTPMNKGEKTWKTQFTSDFEPTVHKFSRNGNRLFVTISTADYDFFVDCYCPATGRRLHHFACQNWYLKTFSPDARCIAVTEYEKRFKFIEVATGRERAAFDLPDGYLALDLAYSPDSQRLATRMVSGKIYIWDVFHNEATLREFDRDSIVKAWCDLGSLDAKVGFRAICHFAKFPAQSLPFLIEKLPPERMSADAISLWLDQLDARDFALRETAYRLLVPYVGIIVPQLESMRKTTDSLQVREQVDHLLDGRESMTTERLRAIRAVEAIERIALDATAGAAANAQAKAALSRMASGQTGMTLTEEATSAIARLR